MKAKSFDHLYRQAEAEDDYWLAGIVQEFTEEIFDLMEREGITRSELARRLGTSPSYITKILRGNANFTLATMVRLARALGAELRVQLTPAEPSGREEGEVLRHFRRLRARMVEASSEVDDDEVAAEVDAARSELGA